LNGAAPQKASVSHKSKTFFYVLAFLVAAMLFIPGAELISRLEGKKPWSTAQVDVVVEPDNKWVIKDDALGYVHTPGRRKCIINKLFSFTATNRENNLRITHPLETYVSGHNKDEIWIFGCSFTYGLCNDNETFPWLLQERLPTYEVVNFGLGGGGTVQSLLLFEEYIKKGTRPKITVIAYASFHDERNSFLRKRMKDVAPYNNLGPIAIPYARLDHNNKLRYYKPKLEYREFPLVRYSAFMNYIEDQYNRIEDRFVHSHDVSKALMKEFKNLCERYNTRLIIAGITGDSATKEMLEYCRQEGIAAVDISVDLGREGYTNAPYDGHPSRLANEEYAEKLYLFIESALPRQQGGASKTVGQF
jgi:hypothetical protein